jgi:gamma-glutamylputrescine oxidase
MTVLEATRRPWGAPVWRRRSVCAATALPSEVDVAIVGAGLTGVSAAWHLARRGMRPVVLEAALLGDGASGRTGGIVLEGTAAGIMEGVEDCVTSLARLVDELGIACDLRLPGCWEIEHRRGAGSDALPWSDGDSSIHVARTVEGGCVDPASLLTGIAEAAVGAGASIYENTQVRHVVLDPRPMLEVDERMIRASNVIIAINAWTAALLPRLPRIHSALTYACATEPLGEMTLGEIGLGARMPFYTADTPYLWGRVVADGSLIFGAGLTYEAANSLERFAIDAHDSRATLTRLEKRVAGLHPALAEVRIIAGWAGPIAFTEDGFPLLGREPEAPAVLVAGAYAGHGVALSVQAGALMAGAIIDNAPLPKWGTLRR